MRRWLVPILFAGGLLTGADAVAAGAPGVPSPPKLSWAGVRSAFSRPAKPIPRAPIAPPPRQRIPVERVSRLTVADAEAHGVLVQPYYGAIEAAADHAFQGHPPSFESLERLFSPPPGYRARLIELQGRRGQELTVVVDLLGANGTRIGNGVARTFRREGDDLVVHHNSFYLNANEQRKGIGEEVLRNSFHGYGELGVKRVTLNANDAGRYVWARFGFSWAGRDVVEERQASFEKYLIQRVGLPPQKAKALSVIADKAYKVADFTYEGKSVGKDFLLDDEYTPRWSGVLNLDPHDEGYLVAQQRLKL
jgi:L-amino acid N-acyltransferase YncA